MPKRDPLNAKVPMYNTEWHPQMTALTREMIMVQNGGEWKKSNGKGMVGNGLAFHFKALMKELWPWIRWHKWLEMYVEAYLTHRKDFRRCRNRPLRLLLLPVQHHHHRLLGHHRESSKPHIR